ncbi:hypothetical protein BCR44DRAFT_47162 [Catenaria anguillulae PL171]|uniref:Ankyrin repeat-containing domain protein n=1 Tax=Catenaria anguillulae PL171 TaxID=765915 RepID=A0A1Y2H7L0_9FUNG|nr:hypothetical protein BCR44DRAFT_47162 [Catenaria anguillulae PL171]
MTCLAQNTQDLIHGFAHNLDHTRAILEGYINTYPAMAPWREYLTMKPMERFESLYPIDRACEWRDMHFMDWWFKNNIPIDYMYTNAAIDAILANGDTTFLELMVQNKFPMVHSAQGINSALANGHISILDKFLDIVPNNILTTSKAFEFHNGVLHALAKSNVHSAEWFFTFFGHSDIHIQDALHSAIDSNNPDTLEWVFTNEFQFQTIKTIELIPLICNAAKYGNTAMLQVLKDNIPEFALHYQFQLHSSRDIEEYPCETATYHGHVNVLEWLKVNELDFDFGHMGYNHVQFLAHGCDLMLQWWFVYLQQQ